MNNITNISKVKASYQANKKNGLVSTLFGVNDISSFLNYKIKGGKIEKRKCNTICP